MLKLQICRSLRCTRILATPSICNYNTYTTHSKSNKLLLIDGTAIMYRCHFASRKSPTLRVHDNIDISALTGYISVCHYLVKQYQPTHIISCIDSITKNSFRKLLSPTYKQHRIATPIELLYQLPALPLITQSYGIDGISCDTYEGDDVIGTVCHHVKSNHLFNETIIYSPDKDMLQLVDPQHNIQLHRTGHKNLLQIYNTNDSVLHYIGVLPTQIISYLALAGDAADGIAGVDNIGPVNAARLLTEYHTIDNILHAAKNGEIKSKKISNSLLQAEHELPVYYQLATIKHDIHQLNNLNFEHYDCTNIDRAAAYDNAMNAINEIEFDMPDNSFANKVMVQ